MQRVFTGLLLILGFTAAAAAPTRPSGPPIQSRAQLEHYLQVTPLAQAPFGALSPGGRKRFLAMVMFTERGVGSLPTADPANELDQARVDALFDLFGATRQVAGLGLDPAEYARRHAERLADAARRHCRIQDCPESALEKAYDDLVLQEHGSESDRDRRLASGWAYDRLFAPWQAAASLEKLSDPDLRLAWMAADYGESNQPNNKHLQSMRRVLAVMARRDIATDRNYATLHRHLIAARQFAAAALVAGAHPAIGAAPLPRFVDGNPIAHGQPTALDVDPATNTMRREAIDLSGPLRIVVIAGCHFSEDAARAVRADPEVHALFARQAIWLASPAQPIADVIEWNKDFPGMPMHVAWRQAEWTMLDDWGMPTYYVFRNGRETARFQGWQGIDALKSELRKAGALP